jgi:hypothetical protein
MTSDERDAERAKDAQQKAIKKQNKKKQQRINARPADFLTKLEEAEFPKQLSFDDDWWNHNMQPIMMYYENSGHNKFLGMKDLSDPSKMEKTKKEVEDEMLTPDEAYNLVANFAERIGRKKPGVEQSSNSQTIGLPPSVDAHHLICGSCGITTVDGQNGQFCESVKIVSLPHCFVINGQSLQLLLEKRSKKPLLLPTNDQCDMKEFPIHKIQSYYRSKASDKFYHIHPESVYEYEKDEMTILCASCSKWCCEWKKGRSKYGAPENSIASGVDFGNEKRIGLAPMRDAERKVLAKVRLFHDVIKLHLNHGKGKRVDGTQNKLRGSSIAFRHNAPEVASLSLLCQQLMTGDSTCLTEIMKKVLSIQLVAEQGEMETIHSHARSLTLCKCRAYVLFQRLAVYQEMNEAYHGGDMYELHISQWMQFHQAVERANESVMEEIIMVDNSNVALNVDKYEGDDVAKTRSHIMQNYNVDIETEDGNNEESINLNHNFVTEPPTLNISEIQSGRSNSDHGKRHMRQWINDIAHVFGVDIPEDTPNTNLSIEESGPAWKSRRDSDPLNEFEEMEMILTGAFPEVFLLGKAYGRCKSLTFAQMRHLLCQFTNAAGKSRELLFYLYDVMSRHSVIYNFANKVRKDPQAWIKFSRLITDPLFLKKIKLAALEMRENNPKANQGVAKEVLKQVLPVLSFGNRSIVPGTLSGDTGMIARGYSYVKRMGPGCTLLTCTPDDVNNPTSFRLSHGQVRSNIDFPASVDESFFESLRESKNYQQTRQSSIIDIPLSYQYRKDAIMQNPVVVAREFQTLMENVLQILLGCPLNFSPTTNSRRNYTWHFQSKDPLCPYKKGVFGKLVGYFGCIETQGRGALHFHVVLFGGVTPKLLEESRGFEELCKSISKVLDNMYQSEIPRGKYLEWLIVRKMKASQNITLPPSNKCYPIMKDIPNYQTREEWKQHMWENILQTGIHEHSFTCHKPPAGCYHCRMAYGAGFNTKTQCRELKVNWEKYEEGTSLSEILPEVSKDPIQPNQRRKSNCDFQKSPFLPRDDRLIVWEISRKKYHPLKPLNGDVCGALNLWKVEHGYANEVSPLGKTLTTKLDMFDEKLDKWIEIKSILELAKKDCIKEINRCLGEETKKLVMADGHPMKSEMQESIEAYLDQQPPEIVLTMYLELKDQVANGNQWVVCTNDKIHNSTGSSVNALLLGNYQQSCSAMFYVLPYLGKSKAKLESCLIALERAKLHVDALFKDREKRKLESGMLVGPDDTGTEKRFVQHMFTRVVNQLSRTVQVSDTQVALALLNQGSEIGSESHEYFGGLYSINYFKWMIGVTDHNERRAESDTNSHFEGDFSEETTNIALDDIADTSTNTLEAIELEACDSAMQQDTIQVIPEEGFGPQGIYKVPDEENDSTDSTSDGKKKKKTKTIPVHYCQHWFFRGEDLKNLTQYEYAACVDIIPKPKETETNDDDSDPHNNRKNAGRKARKTFLFHPNHPLYDTHVQVYKLKQPTLIINAYPPKYPGDKPEFNFATLSQAEKQQAQQSIETWKHAAQKFAEFYMILFMPHPEVYGTMTIINDYKEQISWEKFCKRVEMMEKSDLLIDMNRLQQINHFRYGFRSDFKNDALLKNFRFRNATVWSEEEKKESKQFYDSIGHLQQQFNELHQDEILVERKHFTTRQIKDFVMEDKYCNSQQNELRWISKGGDENIDTEHCLDQSMLDRSNVSRVNHGINFGNSIDRMRKNASSLNDAEGPKAEIEIHIPRPKGGLKRNIHGDILNYKSTAEIYIENRKLSTGQKMIVKRVLEYFRRIDKYKEHNNARMVTPTDLQEAKIKLDPLLLTGDPGSGKSYVTETICELARIMQVGFVGTTSYNGIAAVNVDGNTISSLFGISDTSEKAMKETLTEDKLLQLQQRIDHNNMCFLIVDEVSTIDTKIIALLDLRLQQVYANSYPFGGIPILFAGDFNQLGPVRKIFIPKDMITYGIRLRKQGHRDKKTPIPKKKKQKPYNQPTKAVLNGASYLESKLKMKKLEEKISKKTKEEDEAVRFKPDSLAYRGCWLFSKVIRYHLKEQKRLSDDASESNKEHAALIMKLSKGDSISWKDIASYKHLNKDDIINAPKEWKYAPVLVATNLERKNINAHQAVEWAKEHNTYVFRWRCQTRKQQNRPSDKTMSSIINDNNFFWQYFVVGAPAFLSYNINGQLALVNGAPVSLHSVTFATIEEQNRIDQLISGDNKLKFGSVIDVEEPLSVNVEIQQTLDDKPISNKRKQQLQNLQQFSMEKEKIIIPLMKGVTNFKKDDWHVCSYRTQDFNSIKGTVEVRDVFPYHIGFAMTVHKAQGRTIHRVIIDLTKHPLHINRMKYASIFVAMSRVKAKHHIRLLKHSNMPLKQSYEYIEKLKPDENVLRFYNGFENTEPDGGMTWSWEKAIGWNNQ